MIDLSHKKLLTTVPLIISLVACATPDHDSESISSAEYTAAEYQTTQYSMAQNYDLDLVEYTVKDGDRLSVIAKEITGQASAWHEIAEFNSIDNPRNLLPGTVLAIPTELIVDHHRSNEALRAQSTQIRPTAQAGASALAVRLNEADNARVVITPINTNRDFKLNPIDPNAPRPTQNYSDLYRAGCLLQTYSASGSRHTIRSGQPGKRLVQDRYCIWQWVHSHQRCSYRGKERVKSSARMH